MIILDSVGIGALPDAAEYNDSGAATLQHLLEVVENPSLPNLESFGLGKIASLRGIRSDIESKAHFGKLASATKAKDTTAGHWELMGIILEQPFPTFPEGFPKDMMDRFTKESGFDYLGNYPASGTEIIRQLGQEHRATGKLIVYTSSDSVFQIAAHEETIPLNELYRACEVARRICDDVGISRVIARPFVSEGGNFVRTTNRRDFSIRPPRKTVLDFLLDAGVQTIGIGKIDDIFAGVGLSETIHSKGNPACIEDTIRAMKEEQHTFIFVNLVDFDMLYGHRRDPQGYYDCLREFDDAPPNIMSTLNEKDLLIISADHGNDPCFGGTDHTREYVPVMIFHKGMVKGKSLGTGATFADIGKTVLAYFGVDAPIPGTSYLEQLGL